MTIDGSAAGEAACGSSPCISLTPHRQQATGHRGSKVRFRSDSAGDPFETEISQREPTTPFGVFAGQNMFSPDDQQRPTPPRVFELYYDV